MPDETRGFVCGGDAVVPFSTNRSSRRKCAAHVQKEILELFVKQELQKQLQSWRQVLWKGLDGKVTKYTQGGDARWNSSRHESRSGETGLLFHLHTIII